MPPDNALVESIPITLRQSNRRCAQDLYVGELRAAIIYEMSDGSFQWEALSDNPSENYRSSERYQSYTEAANKCLIWSGFVPYPESNA